MFFIFSPYVKSIVKDYREQRNLNNSVESDIINCISYFYCDDQKAIGAGQELAYKLCEVANASLSDSLKFANTKAFFFVNHETIKPPEEQTSGFDAQRIRCDRIYEKYSKDSGNRKRLVIDILYFGEMHNFEKLKHSDLDLWIYQTNAQVSLLLAGDANERIYHVPNYLSNIVNESNQFLIKASEFNKYLAFFSSITEIVKMRDSEAMMWLDKVNSENDRNFFKGGYYYNRATTPNPHRSEDQKINDLNLAIKFYKLIKMSHKSYYMQGLCENEIFNTNHTIINLDNSFVNFYAAYFNDPHQFEYLKNCLVTLKTSLIWRVNLTQEDKKVLLDQKQCYKQLKKLYSTHQPNQISQKDEILELFNDIESRFGNCTVGWSESDKNES
jgi:hypothetical protein